ATHEVGDVHRPLRALDGVLALGGAVGGVAAVDGARVLPEPRGDELAEESLAFEHLLYLLCPLLGASGVEVGPAHVVVVELHAVEAELLVLADLGGELDLAAHRRPERVGPRADVPGAEGETVTAVGSAHSSSSLQVPM